MSLNLFDVPDVDYRYEASRDVAFQRALTGTRPITFSILASDDFYDLNELRFQVKVRLTDWEQLAPIPMSPPRLTGVEMQNCAR